MIAIKHSLLMFACTCAQVAHRSGDLPANEPNVWLAEKCQVFGCLDWFLLCFSRGVRSS